MRKARLWRGLSALMAFLLVFVSVASSFANMYAGTINVALDTPTVMAVEGSGSENVDTTYYKSEFGDFTAENHAKFIEATFEQNIDEMKEGAVLLYNKDNALPLDPEEDRLSFFGHANVEALLWGMAATSRSVDGLLGNWMVDDPAFLTQSSYAHLIPDAMRDAGFAINEELWSVLKSTGTNVGRNSYGGGDAITDDSHSRQVGAAEAEDPISVYTDEVRSTWANDYQTAIVTLARAGKEGQDMAVRDTVGDGRSSLALSAREEDLLAMLRDEKEAGRIKKIIVILNTGTPMEVHWLDDYDVDACLFVGAMGNMGAIGVASILSGETNPSGHLTDTYAVNSLSAPAVVNSNGNTPRYLNYEEINAQIDGDLSGAVTTAEQASEMAEFMSFQAEGIYIGYKYYETRYEDTILGQGNATSSKGASNGASEWCYENEVSYPFGHGLSYTTFEQMLQDVTFNENTDRYELTVEVTNTGDVPGKSVVQVYAQTPYGDYERENLVEKSAVQLVGFDKTDLLQPNESQTLIVEAERYLLASYDYTRLRVCTIFAGFIILSGR